MAVVAANNPGLDGVTAQKATPISDLKAGEDFTTKCMAGYIASDGTVMMSNGAAANAAGAVHGIVPRAAKTSEPVALYGVGSRFQWDEAGSLTPGAIYYLASGGGVDSASTLGDTTGIFVAVSTTDLMLTTLKGIGG